MEHILQLMAVVTLVGAGVDGFVPACGLRSRIEMREGTNVRKTSGRGHKMNIFVLRGVDRMKKTINNAKKIRVMNPFDALNEANANYQAFDSGVEKLAEKLPEKLPNFGLNAAEKFGEKFERAAEKFGENAGYAVALGLVSMSVAEPIMTAVDRGAWPAVTAGLLFPGLLIIAFACRRPRYKRPA